MTELGIELLELAVLLFFFSHLWILVDVLLLDLFRLYLGLREVSIFTQFYLADRVTYLL